MLARWKEESRLRAKHPHEPWLWRRDWAEGAVRDTTVGSAGCGWVLAIVWNVLAVPFWFLVPRSPLENPIGYVAALFPLAGVFLLWAAVYQTLRARRFGTSVCRLERTPIRIGETCLGTVETRLRHAPPAGFVVKLESVRCEERGTPKQRRKVEFVLWEDEQTVTETEPGPRGVTVPFRFKIPITCKPTDESNPRNQVLWRLNVSAAVPGVDFDAHFELPVFRK
jgi:hypothetical protein